MCRLLSPGAADHLTGSTCQPLSEAGDSPRGRRLDGPGQGSQLINGPPYANFATSGQFWMAGRSPRASRQEFAQGFALEFQPVAGSTGDPGLADAGGDGRMPHLTQGYPAFVAWRWGLHSAPGIVIREWRSSRRAELTTA